MINPGKMNCNNNMLLFLCFLFFFVLYVVSVRYVKCFHYGCWSAAEITAYFNTSIQLKDPLINVILCVVLLSLVSSNCRLMGEMIFLGTSLGHGSIPAPSESSPMNQQQQHFSEMYCITLLSMGICGSDEWTHGRTTTALFGSSDTGDKGQPGCSVITSASATQAHI